MDPLVTTLLVLVGVAVSAGVTYFAGRKRYEQALADRLAAEADARRVPDLEDRLGAAQSALESERERTRELDVQVAELSAKKTSEEEAAGKRIADLKDINSRLSDTFGALSADALKKNNQAFLDLAKNELEKHQKQATTELDKKHTAIEELVKPIGESLKGVDKRIQELDKARAASDTSLKERIEGLRISEKELQEETRNLARALRSPQARGRWGELQLRRVVEFAGMLDHCDFIEQKSHMGEDGLLRPDLIVNLCSDRQIVVDSKVPLEAYGELVNAEDSERRRELLESHAKSVRGHMRELGKKSYWKGLDRSPEFVVLFLPGEGMFSAALESDPDLISAGGTDVIIASPTTLIALLRASAFAWREEKVAEHAKEISDHAHELYKRLTKAVEHLARVGDGLRRSTLAYNDFVGSMERRVLVTAREFKKLGVVPDEDEIPKIPQVEIAPRALQAPEFREHELPDSIEAMPVENSDSDVRPRQSP